MSDAERFNHINRQCEHVADLIRQAEKSSDADQAARLYGEARSQTSAISNAIRQMLAIMSTSGNDLNQAA